MKRVVAWLRVIGLLAVEGALFALFWFAGPVLGRVGWSNLHAWLADSTPQGAVTALIRVFGLIGSGWVLATSLLWVLAGLAGFRGLQARFGRLTLPMVRRLLQPVAGLSMMASVAMSSGVASASAPLATAHVLTVGSNPLHQKVPVSQVALPDSVPVSASAIGRHIAHPGVIDHKLPAPGLGAAAASVPSPANGFAGLKAGTKVYVVQPGDCLSVIAQDHLGDWRLDLVIDEMNRGRLQPDGRELVDDHWIYPGWVLVMPQDATGVITVTAHGHTVQAPPKHEQKHQAQHLKDSSGSASPHTSAPAVGTARSLPVAPTTAVPTTVAPLQTTIPQVPTTAVPVTPTTVAPPVPVPVHGAGRPGGTEHHDVSSESSGPVVPLPAELLGAGILAAGLVALLRKLDNVRKGRRRLGQPVALQRSGDEARAELAARVGADDAGLLAIDRGLRFFASLVRKDALAVPEVLVVELDERSITVLFGSVPSQPPAPWSMGPDGMSWVLDRSVALPDNEDVAPFPALVSLGESEDETAARVLVNLEAAGVIAFAGDEQVALEAAASMAVELATVPWAQECRLYLYGFGRPEGLGVVEPVTVVEDLADVVDELEKTAAAARQAVGNEVGTRSVGELRLSSDDPVDLGPAVVICAAPAAPELLKRLTELAEDPASGLVAVLTTESSPHQWLLDVGPDGIVEIGPLARRVRLQRLSMPVFDAVQRRLEHALPERPPELELAPEEVDEAPEVPGCNLAADWWEPPTDSVVAEEAGDDELDIVNDDVEGPDELVVVMASGTEARECEISGEYAGAGEDIIELGEVELPGEGEGALSRSVPSLVRLVPELVRPPGLAPILTEQGASVVVQVLHGFPRVWRVDGDEPAEIVVPRLRSLEAIVYLALRQDASGVSSHRLAEALHPEKVRDGRKANDQTFATEMTTARKALDSGRDGTQLLPPKAVTGGKFLLSEKVITDWSVLRDLLHQAEESAEALADEELYQLVSKAFSLVGDEAPFAEVRRRSTDARRRANGGGGGEAEHWRWVDIEHASIDDDVADTAAWMAKFANEYRRHHEARVAAHLGLKVSPVREDLCEELLKAESALGGTRAVQKAWDDIERSFEAHAEPYDVVPNELRHTYTNLVSSSG